LVELNSAAIKASAATEAHDASAPSATLMARAKPALPSAPKHEAPDVKNPGKGQQRRSESVGVASVVILDLVEADDLDSRKRLARLVVHSKACAGGVHANICKTFVLPVELGRTIN